MAKPIQNLTRALEQRGAVPVDGQGRGRLRIDHYRVVLAELPEQLDHVPAAVDASFQHALEVWRTLTGPEVADLYLFLVGPEGRSNDDAWKAVAARLERDSRICRKLVWLPDGDAEDVERFLSRSFLARPWAGAGKGAEEALALFASTLKLPDGWMDLLLDNSLDEAKLTEELMASMPRSEA